MIHPKLNPVPLSNPWVTLTPTSLDDAAEIVKIATPETFALFAGMRPYAFDLDGIKTYIEGLLVDPSIQPYTVVLNQTGETAGITTYLDIRPEDENIEVGGTWYGEAFRGTVVNPAAKLAMCGNAFEHLDALRVCLKTDGRNLRSQAAIKKLGAQYEGTLRRQRRLPDGFIRDTVYFSILNEEWPAVKQSLLDRCQAFDGI